MSKRRGTRAHAETKLGPAVWNSPLCFARLYSGDRGRRYSDAQTESRLEPYGIVAVLGFWLILFNRPVQLTLNKLRAAHEEAWR